LSCREQGRRGRGERDRTIGKPRHLQSVKNSEQVLGDLAVPMPRGEIEVGISGEKRGRVTVNFLYLLYLERLLSLRNKN